MSEQTNNLANNLITLEDENILKSESPLAVVMGNYFKVNINFLFPQFDILIH